MKEETKHIYLNNIGIKIGSVFFALLIWMIIINIDDPYKTRTFSVNVETINESALQSVNKVYEVIDGSTASVKVRGKKSVVDKLEASDIRATADLSDLSAVNAVAIKPSLTINTGHRSHFHYKWNRIPTVRECARLQSFPDDFHFYGNQSAQFRQVGNAVPPMLGQVIAEQLKKYI